jgi:hypothetical protein
MYYYTHLYTYANTRIISICILIRNTPAATLLRALLALLRALLALLRAL